MKSNHMWCAALAGVLLLSGSGLAVELGDQAPPLKIEKWIKGKPVDLKAGQGKNIYVVEFWATWCGPCRVSIPHLTKVQADYRDKGVVVVGVSVDSDKGRRKTRGDVPEFVTDMGEKMDYTVALDTEDGATAAAYMGEFKIQGIPAAFIIDKSGKLVWVGHPTEGLDSALDEIIAGTYDLKAAKKADKERRAEAEKQERAQEALQNYFELASQEEKPEDLAKAGKSAYAAIKDDPMLLNTLAWEILTNEEVKHRDLKFALHVAQRANELTDGENPAIVDTLARALWDTGQKKKAVELQRKAVKLAEEQNEAMADELKTVLRKYETELEQGDQGGGKPEQKKEKPAEEKEEDAGAE
ncbi:MAG: redoxin family protein [Planctomycetota bacterium]